nr:putative pyrophosphatase PpaX [Lytechinus pictus]XP_054772518.1 putative pyrophosphatase PpaX [Lytechinus pictus]
MNNNFSNYYISPYAPMSDEKKVVIFDKDGTLTCMHAMWAPWLIQTAERMEAATGLSLQDEIYKAMGFDIDARVFGPGILMECTNQVCFEYLCELLVKKGLSPERARLISEECFDDGNAAVCGELLEFGDVHEIFTRLRDEGYYIAVDTADSRIMTEGTLDRLGVSHLVDMVVCGNDAGIKPKPDAYTALKICSRLGVHPRNAVFVGDTITDAMCGKNSNCGLVINVLTGGVDRRILEKKADFVVESIEEAADLILSRDCY